MAVNLDTLREEYQGDNEFFVEITDKQDALKMVNSKTAACWDAGQAIGSTGWVTLAFDAIISPYSGVEKRVCFVCKSELIGA